MAERRHRLTLRGISQLRLPRNLQLTDDLMRAVTKRPSEDVWLIRDKRWNEYYECRGVHQKRRP